MVEFASDFIRSRQPRCPCVLVLDTSLSMEGEPIKQLNEGLKVFAQALQDDPLALKRVEVAVLNFPPVSPTSFQSAADFVPAMLVAEGTTPLGAAVSYALEMVEARKDDYKANRIAYFRPWIFIVTDGQPTDDWQVVAANARRMANEKHVAVFAVAVPGADLKILSEFSNRPVLSLVGLRFQDMFLWLTASLSAVVGSTSHNGPGGDPDQGVAFEQPGNWSQL